MEIRNRVAESKLMTLDLEEHYPSGERVQLDISQWLYEGLILREKEFRQAVSEIDWESYTGKYVAMFCSTDAIIPAWAYMLLTTKLSPYAEMVITGTPEMLETCIYTEVINNMDLSPYRDKPVIVKGCSSKPVPANAYLLLIRKLQPIAKSIMYGEACSSVPLYKRK